MLTSVSRAVNNVKETANFAVASANGISKDYYGENEPANPKNGDTWFYTAGDGFGIRQYVNGQWVEYVNSKTSEQITAQVDAAIANANEYSDNLNAAQTQATNSVASDLAKKADELTKNQQAISSQATAYTDSAVADANSKAVSIGQSAAQNAQSAIDTAKNDFTSSFASQASQTASMASEANSKAIQYASQAKSDAISAANSADGVVRKEFKSTTDSMTATIQQNKSDAEGKISTAQTTATQALDGLATKVSQTEYNTKTGQLQTDLTTTTQTANQAKTDIVSIKQKDGEQDEEMNSIVSDVNGTKQTISDLQTTQGKQSGDIATLQSRADGFEATVTKVNNLAVGGRNLLLNSSRTLTVSAENWLSSPVPISSFSNKKITISAQFDYDSVHELNNRKRLGFELTAFQVLADGTKKTIYLGVWANPSVGDSFHGRKSSTYDLTGMNITPSSVASPNLWGGGLYIQGVVGDGVSMSNPKLEIGTIATDWTPAPEDLSSATAKAQLTADNATLAINNYKTDADGRISKAQADIKVNADAIATKVAKTDYDQKTGELITSVNTAQQTADTATQTIGTYKESNDKRVSAAETNIQKNADAIKSTVSKTDFDKASGKLSGDISTLQQRADGFDATVTKVNNLAVGGRNLLLGTTNWTDNTRWNQRNTVTTNTYRGMVIASTSSAWTSPVYLMQNAGILQVGKTYTFSTYVRNTSDTNTQVTSYYDSGIITPNAYKISLPAHTDWTRVFVTFKIIKDPATSNLGLRWEGENQLTNGFIQFAGYKLEEGNIPTDWTPAPEDIETQLSQVKLTADGVYQTVNNPQTGLNTRVSTAEGNISTIKSNVDGMSNTVTQTANGLTQEIADRKTGDSNTLQAGKDFTTSQITSYDTGMQSRLAQVSDGIMATVNSSNFVVDSSFVNGTDNWNKFGEGEWKIDVNNTYYGVRFIAFNNFNHANEYAYLTSQKIYKNTIPGKKVFVSVDVNVANVDSTNNNYAEVYVIQENSSGRQIQWNSITQQLNFSTKGWQNFREEIDIDDNTNAIYIGYQVFGNVEVYISRPYIGVTELPKNGYIAGPNSNNTTQLSLFYNSFSLGIKSNTGEIISGINGDSSGLIITGKKITVSGDTTFIGNNFMDGAIIKNASIGSAQIADASITNAKISNLDVNKLSGNISNFIQSNWNGQYGSTTIDANGMTVGTGGITTKFGSYGMTLNMTGESVGGIGVQGLTGQPSDYQGLTFWLDGNAEYMAWGARNNGATSGNPVLKLSWFRDNSVPTNAYAGFNFDDDVIFNKGINVPGASTRKIIFGTQNFLNYNYSYFGDSSGQAGWSFGGTQTYLISGTTYYNATKVIAALNGIGAAKIPTEINSDGTVKKWANVTL